LQRDGAGLFPGKPRPAFELGIGDQRRQRFAVQSVLQNPDAIHPMLHLLAPDDDSDAIPFAGWMALFVRWREERV
jgi:hypothetical protein